MNGPTGPDPWQAARLRVLACAPYLRRLLFALVVRPEPGVGTMGVSREGVLYFEPEWVGRQERFLPGLLVHELLHLLLRHWERAVGQDLAAWNRACDRAVNPLVRDMRLQLPDGLVWPADLHAPEGLTAEQYLALERQQGGDKQQPSAEPMPGRGACGSCAGAPLPCERAEHGRPAPEVACLAHEAVAAVARQARERPGSVPGALTRLVEQAGQPTRVPWTRVLAGMVRRAARWRAGQVQPRYDGPSRRQAGLGWGPGRAVLPRLRAPVPTVALIVDTSASMDRAALRQAVAETRGVLRACGQPCQALACDTVVQARGRVGRADQLAPLLRGGGGTDLVPALQALASQPTPPDLVVVMTDGQFSSPEPRLPFRVIWCLVGSSPHIPCWGRAILVD